MAPVDAFATRYLDDAREQANGGLNPSPGTSSRVSVLLTVWELASVPVVDDTVLATTSTSPTRLQSASRRSA
jgi:hypothetical protein